MTWDGMSTEDLADWERFCADVRENLLPGLASSAYVVSLAPEGEPDLKLAVETGLAVLLDKPIVAVSIGGRPVPPGLARVARAVIEVDDIDDGGLELWGKLGPVLQELDAQQRE